MNYSSWDEWNPKAYLKTYFSDIEAEEEYTLSFLVLKLNYLDKRKKYNILEFGCGPTIAQALPLVPYAEKIYLADYLMSNLDEIKSWLRKKPSAFDWSKYTKRILELEGREVNKKNIFQREYDLRKKINRLLLCNAGHFPTLKNSEIQKFPVIVSTFSLDS